MNFSGPTWRRPGQESVLLASRRYDGSTSRKTEGSMADTLQCNLWRRAQPETPHRMTHSLHGGNDTGLNNVYKSSVKTKARKTNNQASFSSSLLQNNIEVEEAIELARHLDETGLHRVSTGFDKTWSGLVGSYHSNRPVLVCTKFAPSSCQV